MPSAELFFKLTFVKFKNVRIVLRWNDFKVEIY